MNVRYKFAVKWSVTCNIIALHIYSGFIRDGPLEKLRGGQATGRSN